MSIQSKTVSPEKELDVSLLRLLRPETELARKYAPGSEGAQPGGIKSEEGYTNKDQC